MRTSSKKSTQPKSYETKTEPQKDDTHLLMKGSMVRDRTALKRLVLACAVVSVVIFAVFMIVNSDNSSTNNAEKTAPADPTESNPLLVKINSAISSYRVSNGDFDGHGSVYLPIDQEFRFFRTTLKPQATYSLERIAPGTQKPCESALITTTLSSLKDIFTEEKFATFESSAYGDEFSCTRVLLASNNAVLCSIAVNNAQRISAPSNDAYMILGVFCEDSVKLSDEIELSRQASIILAEAGHTEVFPNNEVPGLNGGYIKEAKYNQEYDTPYMIAKIVTRDGYEMLFFKKQTDASSDNRWVSVSKDVEPTCEVIRAFSQDAFLAFRGEKCYSTTENILLELN